MPRTAVSDEGRRLTLDAPTENRLAIEYVRLDLLMQWPVNPKEHDIGAIAASIERFGMRDPIAVNRRNNEIEEGHGRRDTLWGLYTQQRPAPRFVQTASDGMWLVPVLWFDDDPLTQHGYALAHNRTQELGGGYNEQHLLTALREQAAHGALVGLGWDTSDLEALRKRMEQTAATDQTGQIRSTFQVLITCADEQQQTELLDRFLGEGLPCRALTS